MFNFGEFYTLKNGTGNYSVWELFLFMIIGGMVRVESFWRSSCNGTSQGGILGALFIHLSTKIQIFRRGFAQNSKLRFLELLATAVLMATACFTLPLIWKQCNDKPVDVSTFTSVRWVLSRARLALIGMRIARTRARVGTRQIQLPGRQI
jgi:hypothetical protein